jgi:hypothetical protein
VNDSAAFQERFGISPEIHTAQAMSTNSNGSQLACQVSRAVLRQQQRQQHR